MLAADPKIKNLCVSVPLCQRAIRVLDVSACNMHNACMSTKTISLKMEAYKKLKAARRYPEESFSQVILRATWPEETITAREFLERYRKQGPFFKEDELAKVEKLKRTDRPPVDKWKNR